MPSVSLRQLAQKLGVSHATVSDALRDSPRVAAATKARVLQAAAEAGYVRNPLAGALMSEMRRSQTRTFRGVIAVLDMDGEEGRPPRAVLYHRELARGARERAEAMGFRTDFFTGRQAGLSFKRIDQILRARGISGVFLLPVGKSPDLARLDWTHFSGIYSDYRIEQPRLHSICPDHYGAMFTALERLHDLGYRRPGLVMDVHGDARLRHRWEAAYHAYQAHHDWMTRLPALITDMVNLTERNFARWFKSAKCDVVLAHQPKVKNWMIQAGAKVPETHGFCCLRIMSDNVKLCAGLDLQPRLIGERGMELLIGQMLRNECGLSDMPMTTTVPALWMDGPTVRMHAPPPSPANSMPSPQRHRVSRLPSPPQPIPDRSSSAVTSGSRPMKRR